MKVRFYDLQVYQDLKTGEATNGHFKVYKKEDIPEDLKYKNHSRIPPIVVIPEPGYLLKKKQSYKITLKGNHGFDNTNLDMKTTFLARGPNFRRGFKQDAMKSVDLYPLLCHILDLKNCHKSRGSIEVTKNLLSAGGVASVDAVQDPILSANSVGKPQGLLSLAFLLSSTLFYI